MNRLLWQLYSMTIRSGEKRARLYKKNNLFGSIGDNVMIQDFRLPYNPKLVFIGNNVRLASNVTMITHDVIHNMLNNIPCSEGKFEEKTGKIFIGNNVFVGANTIIMYDVKIGNNVIVGAGSIVTKDLPDNSICVGAPCKRVGSFYDFVSKRRK